MLKISCISHKKNGKIYEVSFDSGARFRFENLRKENDFVTRISKKCTDALIFINSQYSYLHSKYRDYYFLIDKNDTLYTIENSLDYINNKIALLLFRTSGVKNNYMVIKGDEQCLNELCSVYTYLTSVEISRRSTVTSHLHRVKSDILQLFLGDFLKFEKELIKEDEKLKIKVVQLRRIS